MPACYACGRVAASAELRRVWLKKPNRRQVHRCKDGCAPPRPAKGKAA